MDSERTAKAAIAVLAGARSLAHFPLHSRSHVHLIALHA